MRKCVALLLVGVVGVGALGVGGASAAKPRTRTVRESYSPLAISRWHVAYLDPGVSVAELLLRSQPGEDTMSVTVEDELGTLVRVGIEQAGMPYRTFCGATKEPLEIIPQEPFYVVLYSGHCQGSIAAATAGTVEIAFHRTGAKR